MAAARDPQPVPKRDWTGITAAGNQCQYESVGYKKPTRLLGDVPGIEGFGWTGWPSFDADGWYRGPVPKDCGHRHARNTIGVDAKGGFRTSPLAAYPPGMCE